MLFLRDVSSAGMTPGMSKAGVTDTAIPFEQLILKFFDDRIRHFSKDLCLGCDVKLWGVVTDLLSKVPSVCPLKYSI